MTVSLQQFVDRVAKSGLLSGPEVQALVDSLTGELSPEDCEQLARKLVREKKLTAYQARKIYADKGESLVMGNYVILDKLGQGGMGLVLKAEHRRMERVVAIKVLSPAVTKTPKALARFQREVKAAARLEHPNIVTAYDADEAGDTHFLVMQYVDGTDLWRHVQENGALSVGQAVSCILQAARGLDYAHSCGVVHRDIKPSNLLLAPDGTTKVLDMGLARLESSGEDQDQLTCTGQIMGTVDYMAPEQAINTRSADARSDIYSLGITLWYLLTARPCFTGETAVERLMAHQSSPIPSLREECRQVSPDLEKVFATMIAKSPTDRYQSMREVIADLERSQSGPVSAPPVATAPGEDSALNVFLSDMRRTNGPLVKRNTSKEQAVADTSGLEPTATMELGQVDTDPDLQHALASPRAAMPATRRKPILSWSRSRVLWLHGFSGSFLLLAAIVFFLQIGEGVIRVEINDPLIEVAIKGTEIVLKQVDQGKDVRITPGEHILLIERGDFRFETDKLILKRGANVTVRVELLAGRIQVRQGEKVIGKNRLPRPSLAVAPFDSSTAKEHQQAWADYLGLPVEKEVGLPGGERLTMVLIPPGEFLMGSTEEEVELHLEEAKAQNDTWSIDYIPLEGPQHRVRISQPLYLGKYELTQAQWQAVTGSNPSKFDENPTHPVETVSWDDIQSFLPKLNEVASTEQMKFALPTEAQWEYACRAGTTTSWHFGESEARLQDYGWSNVNSGGKSHPVGQLKPNAFGLYDMYGNVWELMADQFEDYAQGPVDDPTGGLTSPRTVTVLRGGDWKAPFAGISRSAFRTHNVPEVRNELAGFRLAAALEQN